MFCRGSLPLNPSAAAARTASSLRPPRSACTTKRTAAPESTATERSVITTGKCAAIVGSIARNAVTHTAAIGLSVRATASAKNSRSSVFSTHIAARARACTRAGSLSRKTMFSVKSRSSILSANRRNGGIWKACPCAAPTHILQGADARD